MALLYDTLIAEKIAQARELANKRAWVASAFCRSEAFTKYVSNISASCADKFIVVRWQARDILAGASDLNLYPTASQLGWQIYLNPELHAKAYLFDDIGILGSANLTNRGMSGHTSHGNLELATVADDFKSLTNWFENLRSVSRVLDDQLFAAIKSDTEELETGSLESALNRRSFSAGTMALFAQGAKISLYTNDLLWSSSPHALYASDNGTDAMRSAEHDIEFLNLGSRFDESAIKQAFLSSIPYQWLCATVSSEMYFGALTQALHNDLLDDPAPYRKEVKGLVSNLLEWAEQLAPEEFKIDIPSHSQRIIRISANTDRR